jgi:Mn-dependent DtxR family transcriptional regulator
MDIWKQFEENQITHSAAHHLLAISELRSKRGYARVTDVARHLNITVGSASTNLKNLKGKGYIVEDENRFLSLSEEGGRLVRAVELRKEVFYKFLVDVLSVDPVQAEIDACKTEHLISAETTSKLKQFLDSYPK